MTSQCSTAKRLPGAAESGHHFVGDQQRRRACRRFRAACGQYSLTGGTDAARRAHHRLGDKRRDRVGAVLEDGLLRARWRNRYRIRGSSCPTGIGSNTKAEFSANRTARVRSRRGVRCRRRRALRACCRDRRTGVAMIFFFDALPRSLVVSRIANLSAASTASDPPLVKKKRSSPGGVHRASRATSALALGRGPDRHDVVELGESSARDFGDFLASLADVDDHGAGAAVEDFAAVGGVEPRALGALDQRSVHAVRG